MRIVAAGALALALLAGAITLAVSNYNECRGAGFSVLYCLSRR